MSTEPDITGENTIDPTPYIRTFAKDFASLSGKNLESQHNTAKKKISSKKIKKTKQPKQSEALSELETQTSGIEQQVEENIKQLSAREADTTKIIELPKIDPGDIISQLPPAPVESKNSAAILARLKARASENKDGGASISTPPASPPPALPISQSSLIPTKTPAPLHTFKTDFQDHIKEEHASKFSVLAAQKDAPVKIKSPEKKHGAGILMTTAAIILIIAGGGLVFAAYSYIHKNQSVANIEFASSIISPDSRVMLTGNGAELLTALAQQAEQPLPNNTVELAYVNESTTTAQGIVEEPASGGTLITELNLEAPDILLRNIDPSSVVGIVSAESETSPFFVLRVTSYERTFAGMLEWEPNLYEQLSTLYPEYPAATTQTTSVIPAQNTSSTSTSTSPLMTSSTMPVVNVSSSGSGKNIPASQFVDETVSSHDVRALKDSSGRTLVLYGYADKQTLIIARNEDAFTLLLNRLASGTN